jgi:hypothetical protein
MAYPSDAIDPNRTKTGPKSRSAAVSGSSRGVLSFGATARELDQQRLTLIQNI